MRLFGVYNSNDLSITLERHLASEVMQNERSVCCACIKKRHAWIFRSSYATEATQCLFITFKMRAVVHYALM